MFFDLDLRGDALPPKTLCLTYDDGPGRTEGDGPGPRTAEIGHYLAGRGIAATFFVLGCHVRENPGIVAQLRAGGHLVANHTDTHPTLVSFIGAGGDVIGELARADEAIGSPSAAGELTFFRAPYGYWREAHDPDDHTAPATTSAVASALNRGDRFPHLVGPVGWDIDARDWNYWRTGGTAEECGQDYLAAIEAQGRGIILLHDSSESSAIRAGNRTAEVTRWLVPELEARGYHFVRLDEVPGVASAARVTRQITFGVGLWQWLTCPADSTRIKLTTSHSRLGGRERFGVVPIDRTGRGELVALRAWNGRYLMRTESRLIVAEATTIDDSSRWLLKPGDDGRVAIWSNEHEAIRWADHPCEVHLAQGVSHPMHFDVAVASGETTIEPK